MSCQSRIFSLDKFLTLLFVLFLFVCFVFVFLLSLFVCFLAILGAMHYTGFSSDLFSNFINHKNCNFLAFDWFKKGLFSTNSLAKLLSDSLLLDSLLLDSLLSDSSKSQSHSKCSLKQPITFKVVITCAYACACFCVFAFVFFVLLLHFNANFLLFSQLGYFSRKL